MQWYLRQGTATNPIFIGPFARREDVELYHHKWIDGDAQVWEKDIFSEVERRRDECPIDTTPWEYLGISKHHYEEQNARGERKTIVLADPGTQRYGEIAKEDLKKHLDGLKELSNETKSLIDSKQKTHRRVVVDTEDQPRFRVYCFMSGRERTFHGWLKADGQIGHLEVDAGLFSITDVASQLAVMEIGDKSPIGEKILEVTIRRVIK